MKINYGKSGRIAGHKYWEIQLIVEKDFAEWFALNVYSKSKSDHGGFRIELEFFRRFHFHLWIYDDRHWDYERDCWQEYLDFE
jgi:hypothetical protein